MYPDITKYMYFPKKRYKKLAFVDGFGNSDYYRTGGKVKIKQDVGTYRTGQFSTNVGKKNKDGFAFHKSSLDGTRSSNIIMNQNYLRKRRRAGLLAYGGLPYYQYAGPVQYSYTGDNYSGQAPTQYLKPVKFGKKFAAGFLNTIPFIGSNIYNATKLSDDPRLEKAANIGSVFGNLFESAASFFGIGTTKGSNTLDEPAETPEVRFGGMPYTQPVYRYQMGGNIGMSQSTKGGKLKMLSDTVIKAEGETHDGPNDGIDYNSAGNEPIKIENDELVLSLQGQEVVLSNKIPVPKQIFDTIPESLLPKGNKTSKMMDVPYNPSKYSFAAVAEPIAMEKGKLEKKINTINEKRPEDLTQTRDVYLQDIQNYDLMLTDLYGTQEEVANQLGLRDETGRPVQDVEIPTEKDIEEQKSDNTVNTLAESLYQSSGAAEQDAIAQQPQLQQQFQFGGFNRMFRYPNDHNNTTKQGIENMRNIRMNRMQMNGMMSNPYGMMNTYNSPFMLSMMKRMNMGGEYAYGKPMYRQTGGAGIESDGLNPAIPATPEAAPQQDPATVVQQVMQEAQAQGMTLEEYLQTLPADMQQMVMQAMQMLEGAQQQAAPAEQPAAQPPLLPHGGSFHYTHGEMPMMKRMMMNRRHQPTRSMQMMPKYKRNPLLLKYAMGSMLHSTMQPNIGSMRRRGGNLFSTQNSYMNLFR